MPREWEGVRRAAAFMSAGEVLGQPVTALLGVDAAAGQALGGIGIATVFDLAASAVFQQAREVRMAADPQAPAGRYGLVPGDWFVGDQSSATADALADLDLAALRVLAPAQADALKAALDVHSIADLAAWPPYAAARALLSGELGGTTDGEDGQAETLRPRLGEYATDKVYYSTLVMLHMDRGDAPLKDVTEPLSIGEALAAGSASHGPAIGAVVRLEQSWQPQGVTLGQMRHSLALAPGEATRIAVIDWSRTTSASTSESIDEGEALDNTQLHSSAISEIQNAMANEMQNGGSTVNSTSTTKSMSASLGVGLSIGPVGIGASGSIGKSTTETEAESTSWSLGSRTVTANMAQNAADRTQQHSTLVRNRRATAIREVSQAEHEAVSTRIVANYNHMHALTVQYYEVVQIYRVTTAVRRVDRVLMLPIAPIDFTDGALVDSLRGRLIPHALTARASDLLIDPDGSVIVRPDNWLRPGIVNPDIFDAVVLAQPERLSRMARMASISTAAASRAATTATTATPATTVDPTPIPPEPEAPGPIRVTTAALLYDRDAALATAAAITGTAVRRPANDYYYYPNEVEIVGVRLDGLAVTEIHLIADGAATGNVTVPVGEGELAADLDVGQRLGDFREIEVKKRGDAAQSGAVRLVLSYRGRRFDSPALLCSIPQGAPDAKVQRIAYISGDATERRKELADHLMANRNHYTVAAFAGLDPTAVGALISGYQWQGKPLATMVEPRILSVAGNFLVLGAPVDEAADAGFPDADGQAQNWGQALHGLALAGEMATDTRQIPVPTAGVFAEAVLGRSNSAEKIDLTRFWAWHEAVPPFAPTDIAPVATGSRKEAETLTPGQLGAANLTIATPTVLPAPAGLTAALGTLGTANLFRDMSGLAGTQSLAATNVQASGAALKASLEANTEAMKIAADLRKAGKEEEAKKTEEEAKKAVQQAQQTHDADKAQAAKLEGQINKTADAAIAAGNDIIKRVGDGTPVPGEATPSETVRGGRAAMAESSAQPGSSAATATTPATVALPIKPVKNIAPFLVNAGRSFSGAWTVSLEDTGFAEGDALRKILPTRQSGMGSPGPGGSASEFPMFAIPTERAYKGPILVKLDGVIRCDDPAAIVSEAKLAAAWNAHDEALFNRLVSAPSYTMSTTIYSWAQEIELAAFLAANTLQFRIENAVQQALVLTVKRPAQASAALEIEVEKDVQIPGAPADVAEALTIQFMGTSPAGGMVPGDYRLDLTRLLFPSNAAARKSIQCV